MLQTEKDGVIDKYKCIYATTTDYRGFNAKETKKSLASARKKYLDVGKKTCALGRT